MDRGLLSPDDIRGVYDIVYSSRSSFYWGMRFLSFDRRISIYSVYAFCRLVDDIADDESLSRQERRHRLDIWRKRIETLYDQKRGY